MEELGKGGQGPTSGCSAIEEEEENITFTYMGLTQPSLFWKQKAPSSR
jgi:hypothetical protein